MSGQDGVVAQRARPAVIVGPNTCNGLHSRGDTHELAVPDRQDPTLTTDAARVALWFKTWREAVAFVANLNAAPPQATHIMCIGWPTIKRLADGESVWFDDLQCGAVAADDLHGADIDGLLFDQAVSSSQASPEWVKILEHHQHELPNGRLVPARMYGHRQRFFQRLAAAWLVFTGRADALVWMEDL